MAFVESLLARYLNAHAFTELHLDSIFKYGDDNTLPLEVSTILNRCPYFCVVDVYHNSLTACTMLKAVNLSYLYVQSTWHTGCLKYLPLKLLGIF